MKKENDEGDGDDDDEIVALAEEVNHFHHPRLQGRGAYIHWSYDCFGSPVPK